MCVLKLSKRWGDIKLTSWISLKKGISEYNIFVGCNEGMCYVMVNTEMWWYLCMINYDCKMMIC